MNIIAPIDFLSHFPAFGGIDEGTIISAITQAEGEYDSGIPGWLPVTLNLIAHILTARSMGVAQNVAVMGVSNGGTLSISSPNRHWTGVSLQTTTYGQEVLRLLTGVHGGAIFL